MLRFALVVIATHAHQNLYANNIDTLRCYAHAKQYSIVVSEPDPFEGH